MFGLEQKLMVKDVENTPSEFLAFANSGIIDMAPVIRSIGLQYCRHQFVEPLTNFSCGLGLTVICGPSKIVAFWNKGLVLQKTVEMIPIFKFPLSVQNTQQNINHTLLYKLYFYMRNLDVLTRIHDGRNASLPDFCQSQLPVVKEFRYYYIRGNIKSIY